jgi:hypothetical protein
VVLTVLSVPLLIGLVGYGLVHGNDRAIGGFLLVLLSVAAGVIAAPLALLSARNGPHWVLLKALGAVALVAGTAGALVAGTAGALVLFGFAVLQPQWKGLQFARSMGDLRIASVQETPVLLNGHVAGLRLVLELELPNAVTLNRQGMAKVELMNSLGVQVKTYERSLGLSSPFDPRGPSSISFNGKPLKELPGVANAIDNKRDDGHPGVSLPAGRYRIEKLFWYEPFQTAFEASPGEFPEPNCLKSYQDPARIDAGLSQLHGRPLKLTVGVRYDVTQRRDYREFELEAPLKHVYQHTLMAELPGRHPLPSCDGGFRERQQQQEAQEQAQRLLDEESAELDRALCKGDAAGVRVFLARGTPKGSVWAKLQECTVDQPRGELFSLLIPYAYAQSQTGNETHLYCGLLENLHNTGNLDLLARLAAQKLPLLCEGDADVWRNGFDPSTPSPYTGPRKAARVLNDATQLQWLQLMKAQGLPICKPSAHGISLLQLSVKHRSADVIEFLLDAGCDPRLPAPPALLLTRGSEGAPARAGLQPILPVAGWTLRRFRSPKSESTSPIDPERVAAITQRMGTLRAEEINRIEPSTDAPFLVAHRALVLFNPDLFHHLVQQGARLDVLDAQGKSWFNGVRDDRQLGNPKDPARGQPFAMLDALSDAKMRELIRPGPKALEQLADESRTATSFNTYLCKRKLGPCAPLKPFF